MSYWKPSWWQVIGLTILTLIAQRLVFILAGNSPSGRQALDLFLIAASSLAVICCLVASSRDRSVARIFWLLLACAFGMQWIADISWAYYHHFHVVIPDNAIFPSLFYRLYAGPMAIALFLSEDARRTRLESFLDGCIVVGLVGLTMYQIQIAEHAVKDASLWPLITISTVVNVVLVLAATARFAVSRPGTLHGLFARQMIYLLIYSSIALITSYVDAYLPQIDSSVDLIWIVTYLAAAAIAITWSPAVQDVPPRARISRRSALLCFNLTLAAMVLGSALLGFRMIDSTRIVGLLAISVVLFSYAIRCSLMQDKQEKYLEQLQESRTLLQQQALYDELTGLPNRRLFSERLAQTLAIAQREGFLVALMYLDLDGFKEVNDSLGHAIGDILLQRMAIRMQSRVRISDTLARLGGDEFTLLFSHLPNRQHAAVLAEELLRTLCEPVEIQGNQVLITASIGIGIYPEEAQDAASLMNQADMAMYAVKHGGKAGVQYYLPEMAKLLRAGTGKSAEQET